MTEFKFDPTYKYGNVVEGEPEELESKLIPLILEDARKILPKGTKFSLNSYKDKYSASVAWRFPVGIPSYSEIKSEVMIA